MVRTMVFTLSMRKALELEQWSIRPMPLPVSLSPVCNLEFQLLSRYTFVSAMDTNGAPTPHSNPFVR